MIIEICRHNSNGYRETDYIEVDDIEEFKNIIDDLLKRYCCIEISKSDDLFYGDKIDYHLYGNETDIIYLND